MQDNPAVLKHPVDLFPTVGLDVMAGQLGDAQLPQLGGSVRSINSALQAFSIIPLLPPIMEFLATRFRGRADTSEGSVRPSSQGVDLETTNRAFGAPLPPVFLLTILAGRGESPRVPKHTQNLLLVAGGLDRRSPLDKPGARWPGCQDGASPYKLGGGRSAGAGKQ